MYYRTRVALKLSWGGRIIPTPMNDVVIEPTDEEVVALTLKEPNAFGSIIERYESKLKRYILRLGVHNHEDQLDVLQEIFIKAYKNLNSFDGSFKSFSRVFCLVFSALVSFALSFLLSLVPVVSVVGFVAEKL